ncbi:MAG: sulfatase-like hydrolase/transferase, partial [Planctomycetales bacterium]|nr:sulfatase-like hydrolase/transferase [Planctomycetales bacterium]
PFFVHVTYTCPHYPLHAKPADIAKYRGKFLDGWEAMRQRRWRRQQDIGLATSHWRLTETDSAAYAWETADRDFEDQRMAVYAAMIDCMDQNIGRLLQTLQATGHDRDTLVLFFSDNGGCSEEPGGRDPQQRRPGPVDDYVAVGPSWGWAQNAPFKRYKSWLHEGGITTPMIAWWPDHIPANRWTRQPAHIIDVMPTLVELAGTEYPTTYNGQEILPVEGTSMLPILRGERREPPQQLAWFWSGNRAVRQGDWKLVWDKRVRRWELYDLAADRCESRDLAEEDDSRVQRMSADWFAWAQSVGLKTRD